MKKFTFFNMFILANQDETNLQQLDSELFENELNYFKTQDQQTNFTANPFWSNIYQLVFTKTRRRIIRGIYDECCRKPCSYNELGSYCRMADISQRSS